jgi:cob(I)alamin adenosyltransferase
LERWELQQIVDNHPVILKLSSLMPMLNALTNNVGMNRMLNDSWTFEEMVVNFRANQNMLYQIRGELGMPKEGNMNIHDQVNILTQRMNTMEAALSTLEKVIFLLQRQLGFTETLRLPDAEPIEERLDEHGLD